jgi:DNA repair protein RadC
MKPKKVKLAGLGCFHVVKVAEAPPVDVSNNPPAFVRYWREVIAPSPFIQPDKEHVVVVALNLRLKVMGWHLVSMGGVCGTYCGPREVMRPLILCAASHFVMMHNHPSGDPSPSDLDRKTTRRIREAGETVGIPITDHIIIGDEGYFSFSEHGLI